MTLSSNLEVGTTVAVVYESRNYPNRRQYNSTVVKVNKAYVELSDGRRFSVKTQKELKSDMCRDTQYSSLIIDSPARYDAQEAIDTIRRDSKILWQNLRIAVQNRDFDEVKRGMVLLDVFRTNHPGF